MSFSAHSNFVTVFFTKEFFTVFPKSIIHRNSISYYRIPFLKYIVNYLYHVHLVNLFTF